MGMRKIAHMHVVADASSVWRGIIVTENLDRRETSHGREEYERNEVGFRLVHLADLAIRIGAGCVEVAQRHMPYPMRGLGFFQHSLGDEFGMAVRAYR